MYNTSQNYKNYIKEPSRMFESKIILGGRTLNNDDVIQLKIETGQPSNGFTLGSCISKSLELTLNNDGGAYASVGIVNVSLGLKMGELIEYIPQGIFNIDKVEKTDYTVKVTAYDNMIKFETAYSEKYDNPTLKQVIQQLQDITGVEFDSSVTIPSYTLNKLSGYTCREILGYVASLMGGNAYITRDGKFTIVVPVEVDYTVTSNNYWDYNLEDNTYKIGMLTCQNKLKNDAVDESDDYEAIEEKNTISAGSLGTDNMELTFINPWMTETILTSIYNKLKSFCFLGYSMKWQGDLSLDVGNIINVIDKHGVTRKAFMFSDKINYNGGLTQETGAKGQTKSSNQFSTVDSPTELDRISVKVLLAEKAIIQKANIADLNAVSAKVGTLDVSIATINTALINKANIDDLNATNANVTNLNAQYANLSNAIINKADIADLNAANANISKLQASKADVSQLNATNATIGILQTTVGNIQTLVNGNLTSSNIHSLVLTADKVTVQNGFIKNAMVESLVADKITAGTLSTNKLNIASNDGGLVLSNNTIQFSDKDKNVRVQIGQDAAGDFNFIVKGTDGKTVLLDSTGLHEGAISDGLIKTDMIADNSINSNKIDYSSVISGLNADGSNYINASKVAIDLDGQTLDVAFNSVKNIADSANDKIYNLSVGGRNLLITSNAYKGYWLDSGGKLGANSSTDVMRDYISVTPGEVLTFQKENSEEYFRYNWYDIEKNYISRSPNLNNLFKLTVPQNAYYLWVSYPNTGKVKIEKGNIPTDWTPAPEDVDSSISDIKTITETNTTSISAIQGQISTLISNTTVTVDGKEKTLKDAYSGTVQTVNSINTTIGEHTSTLNTLNGTVSSNTSKITSIQTDLNGVKTSVSSVQSDLNSTKSQLSSLSTTLDGFQSRVESTESNLSNLNVGGRNYLQNTGIIRTVTGIGDGTKEGTYFFDGVYADITETGLYTFSCKTDGVWGGLPGTDTVEFYLIQDKDYSKKYYWIYKNNLQITFTTTGRFWLRFDLNKNNTTHSFSKCKLEKGNMATDWTPAPEDTQAYTDTQISTAKSEIKQTTDSISQSVSNINSSITTINTTLGNKAEKSTVENLSSNVASIETNLSGITQRVSSTESTISTHTTQLGTVDSRINTAKNSAINTASSDATSKANTAQTNALNDAKSYTNGQITTVNSTINTKVAEIKATTDGITQNVSSINSSITTINNTLGNKAEKSTVESISNSVTSLNTTLNGITGRVSSLETNTTTLTTKLNDLNVGGRNLLINSNFSSNKNFWSDWGAPSIREFVTLGVKKWCHIKGSGTALYQGISQNTGIQIDKNTQYTFSAKVKANSEKQIFTIGIHWCNSINSILAQSWMNFTVSTAEEIIKVVFTSPTSDVSRFNIMLGVNNASIVYDVYFTDVKFEKGAIPTDWTPAPEDVENEITTVQETVTSNTTEISALKNSISLKVDSTTLNSYKDTVNGQINTINSSITSMQSSIDLQLDSIKSSVSKTVSTKNLISNSCFNKPLGTYSANGTVKMCEIVPKSTYTSWGNATPPVASDNVLIVRFDVGGDNYVHFKDIFAKVKPSTTYTFSYYCNSAGNITGPSSHLYERTASQSNQIVYTNAISIGPDTASIGKGWVRKITSFTTRSDTDSVMVRFGFHSTDGATRMLIAGLQLEEGSQATDWVEGNTSSVGTIITQSPTEVMTAFNGISKYFEVSSGGAKFGNIATGDYTSMNDKGLIHHVGGSEYEYVYLTYTQPITAVLVNSSDWQYFTIEYQDTLKTLLNGRIPKQIIFSGADTSPDDTSSYFEVYCKTYVIVTEITANNFTVKIKGRSRLVAPSYTVSNNQIFLKFKTYYGGLFSADAIIIA